MAITRPGPFISVRLGTEITRGVALKFQPDQATIRVLMEEAIRINESASLQLADRRQKLRGSPSDYSSVKADIERLSGAEDRHQIYQRRPYDDNGYVCPNCWILHGTTSNLNPPDTAEPLDRLRCPICNRKYGSRETGSQG